MHPGIILARRGMNGGSASGGVAASESHAWEFSVEGFQPMIFQQQNFGFLAAKIKSATFSYYRFGETHMLKWNHSGPMCFSCPRPMPPPEVWINDILRPTYSGMFGARFSSKLTPQEKVGPNCLLFLGKTWWTGAIGQWIIKWFHCITSFYLQVCQNGGTTHPSHGWRLGFKTIVIWGWLKNPVNL